MASANSTGDKPGAEPPAQHTDAMTDSSVPDGDGGCADALPDSGHLGSDDVEEEPPTHSRTPSGHGEGVVEDATGR